MPMPASEQVRILDQVIAEHQAQPVDMLGIGDGSGEHQYLVALRDSYARTIADVARLCGGPEGDRHILELGSFLGAVSVTLKRMGYRVTAADIPEFHASAALRALYARDDIPFDGINLRHAHLPYESGSQHAVILCEVLEHLNFNPLPALAEINRVLRPGACLYIGMPNQASIANRLRLLFGKSIHNPIADFFAQLDRKSNMIVGLHWREYTIAETCQMLEATGFEVTGKYYYASPGAAGWSPWKLLRKLLFLYPPFRPFQVVHARKSSAPDHDFLRIEANS